MEDVQGHVQQPGQDSRILISDNLNKIYIYIYIYIRASEKPTNDPWAQWKTIPTKRINRSA